MKKKLFLLPIILLFLAFTLLGCNNKDDNVNPPTSKETEGVAYGLVNKQYVGMAKVKVKDNKVVDVTYDEAFLPQTWAKLDYKIEEGTEISSDVLKHTKERTDYETGS